MITLHKMKKDEEKVMAITIAVIIIIAGAIEAAKALMPILIIGAFVSLAFLAILLILYARSDIDRTPVVVVGCIFLFCVGGAWVCHELGYTFGDSSIGRAITGAAEALNTANNAEKKANLQVVDELQKAASQLIHTTNSSQSASIEQGSNNSFEVLKTAIKIS